MKRNRLDSSFGTFGIIFGVVLVLYGIYACFTSPIGAITIVVGLFLLLSNTSTLVDFDNKRFKFTTNIFGIIRIGYWIIYKPSMDFAVRECKKYGDFRIVLINDSGNYLVDIKKYKTKKEAEEELVEFKAKF